MACIKTFIYLMLSYLHTYILTYVFLPVPIWTLGNELCPMNYRPLHANRPWVCFATPYLFCFFFYSHSIFRSPVYENVYSSLKQNTQNK